MNWKFLIDFLVLGQLIQELSSTLLPHSELLLFNNSDGTHSDSAAVIYQRRTGDVIDLANLDNQLVGHHNTTPTKHLIDDTVTSTSKSTIKRKRRRRRRRPKNLRTTTSTTTTTTTTSKPNAKPNNKRKRKKKLNNEKLGEATNEKMTKAQKQENRKLKLEMRELKREEKRKRKLAKMMSTENETNRVTAQAIENPQLLSIRNSELEPTNITNLIEPLYIGDFTCAQDGFITAPNVPNARVVYLRGDNKETMNAYLEAEYICDPGYQYANDQFSKLICTNFKWTGHIPKCIKLPIVLKPEYQLDVSDNEVLQNDGTRKCKPNNKCDQICVIKNNKTKCACHKGFRAIGHKCVDINECRENRHACQYGCSNVVGAYRCKCPKGYRNDGLNCVDINECILRNGHGMCQDRCTNTVGNYKCSCEGLAGTKLSQDGHSCEDVDECTPNNGGCSHICVNTMSRVFCLCPEGYVLDEDWKTCVDIDECADEKLMANNTICEYGCVNTPGSYKCVSDIGADQPFVEEIPLCSVGYVFNSTTETCEDINECEINNGGCYDRCENTIGDFDCLCSAGYIFAPDKFTCIISNITSDIVCPPLDPPRNGYLECIRPISTRITNKPGSQCILRCPIGYKVVGKFFRVCDSNGKWLGDESGACLKHPSPKLICPHDIHVELPQNTTSIKLQIPHSKSNIPQRDLLYEPHGIMTKENFGIGVINVSVTAKHPISRLSLICTFKIDVEEGEPPKVIYCPSTVHEHIIMKPSDIIPVVWDEPKFLDNINVTEIIKTNEPGDYFGYGSHRIVYEAKDTAGFSNRCVFKIRVSTFRRTYTIPKY